MLRDSANIIDIDAGKEALMQAFVARVFMKQANIEFKQLRRDIFNGYVVNCREYIFDMTEAY